MLLVSFALVAALVVQFAFAQVSNLVDLSGQVSDAASATATALPTYIVVGLGIFVGLMLFRFGIRLLRRWVH